MLVFIGWDRGTCEQQVIKMTNGKKKQLTGQHIEGGQKEWGLYPNDKKIKQLNGNNHNNIIKWGMCSIAQVSDLGFKHAEYERTMDISPQKFHASMQESKWYQIITNTGGMMFFFFYNCSRAWNL